MTYKGHLLGNLVGGLFALSALWLFGLGHNKRARNMFLAVGLTSVVAILLSQSDEMEYVRERQIGLSFLLRVALKVAARRDIYLIGKCPSWRQLKFD
jgi:hypothetical protein